MVEANRSDPGGVNQSTCNSAFTYQSPQKFEVSRSFGDRHAVR
jgi:hypothetical protein